MANRNVFLDVDTSQLMLTMWQMEQIVGSKGIRQLAKRTVTKVPGHVRRVLPGMAQEEYHVKKKRWVSSQILNARPRTKGEFIGLVIPIEGERGILGGDNFTLAQGVLNAHNANVKRRKNGKRLKPMRIKVNVLQGKVTTLPKLMPAGGGRSSYGNQPPFIMLSKIKRKPLVFTRKRKDRSLPIVRVVGVGVPQMPTNRVRDKLQKDLQVFMLRQLVHEFSMYVAGIKPSQMGGRGKTVYRAPRQQMLLNAPNIAGRLSAPGSGGE